MRLANEIAAAAMDHCRLLLRPGMKESEAGAHVERLRPRRGHRLGRDRSSWRSASRSSGPGRGSRPSPRPATCRWQRTSRRCSRSGSAPTATGATTPRTSARASCAPSTSSSRQRCSPSTSGRSTTVARARASPSSTASFATASPRPAIPASRATRSRTGSAPARTSRPTRTRPAAARSRRAWCWRSSPGSTGRAAAGCASRTTSSSPPTALEKLSSFPDGVVLRMIWTGELNDPYRLGGKVGLYDTTLRDGEQTVGVVLDPEQKLEIARLLDELGIDRIEAGFPRVSQDDWDAVKLISDAGLQRRDLGLLARRARRPRGAGRARRERLGDRVADLGSQARGDRRLAREDARPDHRRHALRGRARDPRGLLRRRLDARAAGLLRAGLQERGRTRARRRSPSWTRSGSPRRRRSRSSSAERSSGSGPTSPCTSTGTTTSASRPRRRSRRCGPARAGCTARSTAWASAPGTRT